MKDSQRNAKKKYRDKGKRITIDFYPSEADLIAQVEKQPQKQTYIKNLIRKDMESKRTPEEARAHTKNLVKIQEKLVRKAADAEANAMTLEMKKHFDESK